MTNKQEEYFGETGSQKENVAEPAGDGCYYRTWASQRSSLLWEDHREQAR